MVRKAVHVLQSDTSLIAYPNTSMVSETGSNGMNTFTLNTRMCSISIVCSYVYICNIACGYHVTFSTVLRFNSILSSPQTTTMFLIVLESLFQELGRRSSRGLFSVISILSFRMYAFLLLILVTLSISSTPLRDSRSRDAH